MSRCEKHHKKLTVKSLSVGERHQLTDDLPVVFPAVQPSAQMKTRRGHEPLLCVKALIWMQVHDCDLLHGNSTACDSAWPSSRTCTLSRNHPQPPPRPSWPIRTRRTCPIDTASMMNSSAWDQTQESKGGNVSEDIKSCLLKNV